MKPGTLHTNDFRMIKDDGRSVERHAEILSNIKWRNKQWKNTEQWFIGVRKSNFMQSTYEWKRELKCVNKEWK